MEGNNKEQKLSGKQKNNRENQNFQKTNKIDKSLARFINKKENINFQYQE